MKRIVRAYVKAFPLYAFFTVLFGYWAWRAYPENMDDHLIYFMFSCFFFLLSVSIFRLWLNEKPEQKLLEYVYSVSFYVLNPVSHYIERLIHTRLTSNKQLITTDDFYAINEELAKGSHCSKDQIVVLSLSLMGTHEREQKNG